ncbi:MAG: isochorismatase family cysteine hydrolase [Elusimicrobiota bacterium]
MRPQRARDIEFKPQEAALVIIDMQRFFLDPDSPAFMQEAPKAVPAVVRLLDAFRRMDRPVIFTAHAYRHASSEGGLMAIWWRKQCLIGSVEAGIAAPLAPRESEKVFYKQRYSAFSDPAFESHLRDLGVKQLLVAGVMTNLCVESTVRDAFARDILCFVAADATAAQDDALHQASLTSMAHGFALVHSAKELLAYEVQKIDA